MLEREIGKRIDIMLITIHYADLFSLMKGTKVPYFAPENHICHILRRLSHCNTKCKYI